MCRRTKINTTLEKKTPGMKSSMTQPGARSQGGDPCLYHALEEDCRVFASHHKIHKRQCQDGVDEKPSDHRQHVKTKHLSSLSQVLYAHDLSNDQTHDAKGRIPVGRDKRNVSEVFPMHHNRKTYSKIK